MDEKKREIKAVLMDYGMDSLLHLDNAASRLELTPSEKDQLSAENSELMPGLQAALDSINSAKAITHAFLRGFWS